MEANVSESHGDGSCVEVTNDGDTCYPQDHKEAGQIESVKGVGNAVSCEGREEPHGDMAVMAEQGGLPGPSSSDAVTLNVGGKLFEASLSTLTSTKNTFFESMFGGR